MDLARTQVLSLVTKAITTVLGIIQSIIVVRILSPAEFGLVGLVMSIGGVVGVTQHLGIVDGAIREIAVLKNKQEIGKVFWVSQLVRQVVTIPVSLVLLVLAGFVASLYGRPEITNYLQLFAGILVLQGLQDVLGATLTGMKRFVALYVVQIVTAAINIVAFGYLTWRFGIAGFFWAIALTTFIMVALLALIVRRDLQGNLSWPSWQELAGFGRRVMKIGAFMYASRIFFAVWQRLPILLLGGVLTADELGYLNVSLTFGSRLAIIAMALSEVNLAWMSSLFVTQRQEFQQVVTRNMHRMLVLMMMLTLLLLFFTPEILHYIIGSEYLPAQPLILVMTTAFFLYALTDIGTSSVFVPANQPRLRAQAYGLMTVLSAALVALLLILQPDATLAAWAVLLGSGAAFASMVVWTRRRFNITLVTRPLAVFLAALLAVMLWLLFEPALLWRIAAFALLTVYILWEARRSKLLPDVTALRIRGLYQGRKLRTGDTLKIICFAGAAYDQLSWTNRQHMMSRVAQRYPVLYVEPRIWIVRHVARTLHEPQTLLAFLRRLLWYEKKHERLFIKAQWNLIPGSREIGAIAAVNHHLNRWNVLLTAWWLGFYRSTQVVWIYDTEAAEYLSALRKAFVLYDCVDDHAAQAGVNRNPQRVQEEEDRILQRADVATVTSKKLLDLKKPYSKNIHLVLNAGDVVLYLNARAHIPREIAAIPHPRLGTVGTLDSYKVDFVLLRDVAVRRPEWHFVLIGGPLVDHTVPEIEGLKRLPNVHFLGAISRHTVPTYVQQFDVCLIPYKASQYNRASFPLKFWEFMATGKPVVVSGVPELREYQPLIGYAESADDFVRLCEQWLAQPVRHCKERIVLARGHSWEKRVEDILGLLHRAIQQK